MVNPTTVHAMLALFVSQGYFLVANNFLIVNVTEVVYIYAPIPSYVDANKQGHMYISVYVSTITLLLRVK